MMLLLAGCQSSEDSSSLNAPEGVTIDGDTAFAEASVIYAKGLNGNWGIELDTAAMQKQDRWLKQRGFNQLRVQMSDSARQFIERFQGRQEAIPKSYYEFSGTGIYVKADTSQ